MSPRHVSASPLYVILVHPRTSFQHVMLVRHLNTSCDCWLDAALVFVCCFRCLPPFGHAYVLVKLQNLTVSSRCHTCVLYTHELSHSFHLLFPFFMSSVCLPLYTRFLFTGLQNLTACPVLASSGILLTRSCTINNCLLETFLSFVCCSCCLIPFIQLYT